MTKNIPLRSRVLGTQGDILLFNRIVFAVWGNRTVIFGGRFSMKFIHMAAALAFNFYFTVD